MNRQEEAWRLQKRLPPGSVVLYEPLEDRTTVVVNSCPWYPGKDLDLYRHAKFLERRPLGVVR